jgi:protein phosphatase
MVVADGMGGHAGGEVASRMAIGTLVRMVLDVPDWIMNLDEANAPRVMERMIHYYRGVDRALAAHAEAHCELAGMGTTMTIAYSIGANLFLAHVGDSRCCLFRDGSLRQLTRDHTQAQRLADAGVLTREEVATSRLRNVLTQALGAADPALEVEMAQMQLRAGDRVLLCTDGLTDMLEGAAIATVMAQAAPPAATCKTLIDLALERGGRDNVTVIVADYMAAPQTTADA